MKDIDTHSINRYALKHWPTHIFFVLMRLIAWLPYPVMNRLGRLLGWLTYKIPNKRTQVARINIKSCFPELNEIEQEQLVRDNIISTGVGIIETALLWFGPQRDWSKLVEIEGLEHYEAAKELGRGGLLLAFHLTSLEIGGSLLGKQIPIAALYRKNEKPLIEEAMMAGRKKFVHPIPREATRDMVRWIKKGGFVWYAADQDYGHKQSIFVPFFGIPTATITATTRFVKLTKAPVIPMTQERIGRNKIKVTLHPMLTDMGEDAERDALTINQFLENHLTHHKSEYLWVHRRFKTRPDENDAAFYPKKKKGRAMTPDRYKSMLEAADTIEEKDGKTYKITSEHHVIYFVYRKKGSVSDYFNPPYKTFVKQLEPEVIGDQRFAYQGLIHHFEAARCDLVVLEKVSH